MSYLAFVFMLIAAIQDFRERHVSVYVLLALLGISFLFFLQGHVTWVDVLLNASYLLILAVIVLLFAKVKSKSMSDVMGVGDWLYLSALIFWFTFDDFVFAMPLSLVGALLLHVIITKFQWGTNHETIPLITFLAPFHFLFMLMR